MAVTSATNSTNIFFDQSEEGNFGLPKKLILRVFSYLDPFSLCCVTKSCRKLYLLGQTDSLWRILCVRDFFDKTNSYCHESQPINWKEHYLNCAGFDYLQIPFPGKSGVFSLDPSKDWKPHYSFVPLIREMCFISETEDSLFSQFSLLGYENGKVALSIQLSTNKNASFMLYLESIDPSKKLTKVFFEPMNEEVKASITTEDQELMKRLFTIFSIFNSISDERSLGLIRKIIWSGNWQQITPLSESESQEIEDKRLELKNATKVGLLEGMLGKILGLDLFFPAG